MQKIVIGFIGEIASGKGTVAKYLQEKYGCNTYRFSTMLRDVAARLYIEPTRENLQNLSRILREQFGQSLLSRVIAEDVLHDKKDLVVVEGVRRPMDIMYLQQNPAFRLVYITADAKTRWERLVQRRENPGDSEKTFEQFTQEDAAEPEQHITSLGKQAPHKIDNNGDLEKLKEQIEHIVAKLKAE
jgi:dephospho-CoA kinase